MKKITIISLSLLLVGCAVGEEKIEDTSTSEENIIVEADEDALITGSLKLTAAQGYVSQDNYETPHTYIIDIDNDEVYVDYYEEGFTEEEREMISTMSEEELDEYFAEQPIYEAPIYDITSLEATKDSISFDYGEEAIVFTALSDSYYETEEGVRYLIQENVTIDDYIEFSFNGYISDQ